MLRAGCGARPERDSGGRGGSRSEAFRSDGGLGAGREPSRGSGVEGEGDGSVVLSGVVPRVEIVADDGGSF